MALIFVVYDNVTGRNTQPALGDNISIPGNIIFPETLTGNRVEATTLINSGPFIAQGPVALSKQFAHINAGKSDNTAETAGLVFQINGSASASTATDLSSGVLTMSSDPTGVYSPGDIIQIIGSAENPLSGLYEVDTVTTSPDEITLMSVPTDAFIQSADDLNNDGLGCDIQKVTLAVLRYSSAGVLQSATGGTAGFTFSDVGGGGSMSLQDAYDGGNTIVMDGAGGALAISGDQDVSITTTSTNGILLETTSLTAGNIVLDSESGITIQTTGGGTGSGITLSTSVDNSGISMFTGSGALNISGTGSTTHTHDNYTLNLSGDFSANVEGSSALHCGAIGTNSLRGAFEAIARNSAEIDDLGVPVYAVNNAGSVNFAAADASALSTAKVVGLSLAAQTTAGLVFDAVCLAGSIAQVRFATAPAATDIGSYVYLSETTGRATLTPPSGSGSVVYELGILVTADGSSVVPRILFNPRFVIEN